MKRQNRIHMIIKKSLLTSLFQREERFPSIKRGLRGVYPLFGREG